MKSAITTSAVFALLSSLGFAGSTAEWKKRAIYQVLTDRFAQTEATTTACADLSGYCGGTFKGIEQNLDYIEGMGFDAIWISPVNENLYPGYHGYWTTNWEEINSYFGSAQDLKDLVAAAHERDIWVMVDVVANHVGPIGTDYSQIYPFNREEHYHSLCQIQDWGNQYEVENCRLSDLPDLNQENEWVTSYLLGWIHDLVNTYGFDGIRIDTIPHVPKWFWTEFAEAAGVFQMGECFNGDPGYVGDYQHYLAGVFNYPMWYTMRDIWAYGQSMYQIRDRYNQETAYFTDIDALGVFVDNHDNARFLHSNSNHVNFRNAIVFALTTRGIPFYYYGSEQYFGGGNDPLNREQLWTNMDTSTDLYQKTAIVNQVRKDFQIWDQDHIERYVDDDFYAFSRGEVLVAVTKVTYDLQRTITYHPYSKGQVVCNVLDSSACSTVTEDGSLNVVLAGGEPIVMVPANSNEDISRIFE